MPKKPKSGNSGPPEPVPETSEPTVVGPDERLRGLMRDDPFDLIEPATLASEATQLAVRQAAAANKKFVDQKYDLDDLMADMTVFWGRAGSVALELVQWGVANAKRVDEAFREVSADHERQTVTTRAVLARDVPEVKVKSGIWRKVGGGTTTIALGTIRVSRPVKIDRRTEVTVSVDLRGVDIDKVYQGVIELEAIGRPTSQTAASAGQSDTFTVVVNVPNFPDDRQVAPPSE